MMEGLDRGVLSGLAKVQNTITEGLGALSVPQVALGVGVTGAGGGVAPAMAMAGGAVVSPTIFVSGTFNISDPLERRELARALWEDIEEEARLRGVILRG